MCKDEELLAVTVAVTCHCHMVLPRHDIAFGGILVCVCVCVFFLL